MWLKKFWRVSVVVFALVGCLCTTGAASVHGSNILDMSSMNCEVLNLSTVEQLVTRASGSIDESVSSNRIKTFGNSFFLTVNETITYDCTYTPKSASVDFGFIAPDGKFYSVPGFNGSIDTTIHVSQSGSYTLAIRNNAAYAVTVTGTVNY